jgi:hypothetical protein
MRLSAQKIQEPLNEFPLNFITGYPNKIANVPQIRLKSEKNVGHVHESVHRDTTMKITNKMHYID